MYEQIVAVLANQLQIDPAKISENTDIVEDLGADSLDIVEILMEMEQTFSLSIPDEEIVKFRTPKDILTYVEEHADKA
ncbi:MAG: acyl carrier protein [Clostridia bacterium]|nr:acyl carrier protein [Clostridia bacterium]MBQ8235922.1 acyl carrier protein [Clostridia bacterium]MBQ8398821.1 acyl carrier protein [Clostridia bacterium]